MAVDGKTLTQIGVQVDTDLRDEFKAVAEDNGRTVSGEIRHMMRKAIEARTRRIERERGEAA